MRIPVLRGRPFTESDDAQSSSVIVVDQAMARSVWPGLDDPIGKQLRAGQDGPLYAVVGVVSSVRGRPLGRPLKGWESATGQVYLLLNQERFGDTLVIRTRVAPLTLVDTIRREIWKLDKNQAISEISTMEKRISDFTVAPRFYMTLFTSLALLAVVLGVTGIYGVISYSVAARTHEIGLRMALGANRLDVFRMVFRRGAALVLTGLAIGLAVACLLSRSLTSLVYEVQPNDPVAFTAISFLFALVSLVACYMPARAATRVDPIVSLRYE
jgi:predicted permease